MAHKTAKKLLIALDGSDRAFETVRYVGHIPPFQNMEVTLFTVFSKIPENYWDLDRNPNVGQRIKDIRAWQTTGEMAIQKYMEEARLKLLDAGFSGDAVTVKIEERKEGVARDIIREAKRGYDAVAVGRKGMGKLKGLLLGSVATKLLEKVTFVPLLVVGRCQPPMKILIALDVSDTSVYTVDYVANTLSDCDCQVTLTHVIRGEEENTVAKAMTKIQPMLDMGKSHLTNCGFESTKINSKIITGALSRAGAIMKEAKEGGYCTIVVGRKGASRVRDFFIGRVSNKIVQLGAGKVVWVVS